MPATIQFPVTPILPTEDLTERAWNTVAGIARDFEQAASEAQSVGRFVQLHERLLLIMT